MVPLGELLLPILLAAALVWIASSIVWMALPWHRSDYRGLPDEEAALAALRPLNLAPGQYDIPHVTGREALQRPEVREKFERGPIGFLYVRPSGVPRMGGPLTLHFLFCLLVTLSIAYVTGRALNPGAEYLRVFQIAGSVGWLGFGVAYLQDAIWFGRTWRQVLLFQLDALIYGSLAAGIFGWLWPGV